MTVFERNESAVGASIRNFGMVWPIGQPDGQLYDRALRSKATWKNISGEAGLWRNEVGSLHLAYTDLEWQVLNEIADAYRSTRPVALLDKEDTLRRSEAANPSGLKVLSGAAMK